MKNGIKLALALGIGAGAILATLATKSQKKVRDNTSKSLKKVAKLEQDDDSYPHYI